MIFTSGSSESCGVARSGRLYYRSFYLSSLPPLDLAPCTRNFRFLHICHVLKSEISPHDQFFLHLYIGDRGDKYEVWCNGSQFQMRATAFDWGKDESNVYVHSHSQKTCNATWLFNSFGRVVFHHQLIAQLNLVVFLIFTLNASLAGVSLIILRVDVCGQHLLTL